MTIQSRKKQPVVPAETPGERGSSVIQTGKRKLLTDGRMTKAGTTGKQCRRVSAGYWHQDTDEQGPFFIVGLAVVCLKFIPMLCVRNAHH